MTKPGTDMWKGCLQPIDVSRFRRELKLPALPIEDERRLRVNCGKCENCLRDRQKDWVGRTIGEAYGADHGYFVTLTIGGDDYYRSAGIDLNPRGYWFEPEEVRSYIKRLRTYQFRDWRRELDRRGLDWKLHVPPQLRFFLVGENGSEKGRVHYHLLVFTYGAEAPRALLKADAQRVPRLGKDVFHGKMHPSVSLGAYEHVDTGRTYWPFGWSCWKKCEPYHSWYVAQYVNKGALIGREGSQVMRPGISTKPLMGARYFDMLAGDHVKQGLSPQARTYRTPTNRSYQGPVVLYWMSDAACRRFAASFGEQWKAVHGRQRWPYSEFIERCEDKAALREHGSVRATMLEDLLWKRGAEMRDRRARVYGAGFNIWGAESPPTKWAELDECAQSFISRRVEVARALERGEPIEGL